MTESGTGPGATFEGHGQHAAGAHAGPRVDERLEESVGRPGSHQADGSAAGQADGRADGQADGRAETGGRSAGDGSAEAGGEDGGDSKWWTLGAVCAGVFILLLDVTIVNVALPDIQSELSANLSDLQWVIDAYALSLAALLLTAGSLADIFGRRRVFVIGTAWFMVGSIACGAAQDTLFLQLARAFQGVGGAAIFATALALIASAFHGRDRGVAFGAFGATTGVAVAVGPVLGGVLTSYLSWRWIFFVNIPICVATIAIGLWRVKETRDPHPGRPDWFGFLTFSLSLGALVYALIRAGNTEWTDQRVVACLVASAVLMVAFVVLELVRRDPMLDLALLRKPTFTGGLIAAFAISASIFSLFTYLVIYLQNVLGFSAVATGLRFLVLSGAAFVAAAVAGRLTSFVPAKWLIAPGFAVTGLGLLLMHGIHTDSSWTHLIPGLAIGGVGIGMINTPLASTAVGVVPVERSGMASGINSTLRQVGIATGIAALGSIFSHQVTNGLSSGLRGTPAESRAGALAEGVTGGQIQKVAASAPAGLRGQITEVATSSFVDGLNHILLIGAGLAFAAAVLTLLLIRQKDFVQGGSGAAGH